MKKEHKFYKICWSVPQLAGLYSAWTHIEKATYLTKDEAYEAMKNLADKLCKKLSTTYATMLNQFGYKMIPESEARAILSNMPNTVASGMVYIADKEFVNKNDLSGVYEEILSDKQLKELLQQNANDVCEIYKQASMAQREIIVDMVVNRKLNGLPIDANIVVEIGKLCGKDLMSITPEEEE